MTQQPFMPVCDCCGLPITAGLGEDCPRCQYPINPSKEAQFLQSSLLHLQRVATYGGANLTVTSLIGRYRARLVYLRQLQAWASTRARPVQQLALPLETQEAANAEPAVWREGLSTEKTILLPGSPSEAISAPPASVRPAVIQTTPPSSTPVAGVNRAASSQTSPPVLPATPRSRVPGGEAIAAPTGSATSGQPQGSQRSPRPEFKSLWRSFVVDQAITLIGLLGAFLILMGALSSVVTTGDNPRLSFGIVFGVHLFFGIVGAVSYRFVNFRLIARIYSGIYVLLVPLVGFTAYNLLVGVQATLSVPTLIFIASLYAAIVYTALAVYQKFAMYGYLGAIALVVADLALAAALHLNLCWWPSMLLVLAFPALASIMHVEGGHGRYFTGSLEILHRPVRVVMYLIVVFGLAGVAGIMQGLTLPVADGTFYGMGNSELRFSLLSLVVLWSLWSVAWLWLTKRLHRLYWSAYLLLICVLAFCYAFDFSRSGYVLTLVGVALLYHGLNRFLPDLLRPLAQLNQHLEGLALLLVCLVPLVVSPWLPLQLYASAYHWSLFIPQALAPGASWAALAELVAVGVACVISISICLLHTDQHNRWSLTFLISGFLLAWELAVIVLILHLIPLWCFLGLALAFVALAVFVRGRFGANLANPLDVLALAGIMFVLSLSVNQAPEYQAALLLGSAALVYGVVLYQRRWKWLFLPLVFALPALPILLTSRLYLALLLGGLLPFGAFACREIMEHREPVLPVFNTAHRIRRALSWGWDWPLMVAAFLYGVSAGFFDVTIWLNGGLPQSSVSAWLGIPFPVALELAVLALAWYCAGALGRVKWWLILATGFACGALLLPGNSFQVLALVTLSATLLGLAVSRRFERVWAMPLYSAGLLSAVMLGIAGYQSPDQLLAASWLLLGAGLLFYSVSILEDYEPGMWLLPVFTLWALLDAAGLGDLYRPPLIALLFAGVGIAISAQLLVTPLLWRGIKPENFLRDGLPFYASAIGAAILTGVYGMLPGAQPPFYGAMPDALLIYALVAFGIVLFEGRERWLWLVLGFAVWAELLAAPLSFSYVCGIGLGLGMLGLLMSRVIKQRVFAVALAGLRPTNVRISWGWPWYVAALFAALLVAGWPLYDMGTLQVAEYALLAFGVIAYLAGTSENLLPLLWISPLLVAFSLGYSAYQVDTTRLLVIALICVVLGVATNRLRLIQRLRLDGRTLFHYALPFYMMALIAALFTGLDGTFNSKAPLFYLMVLLLYALIAYAVSLIERRPVWSGIVVVFTIWALLLTTNLSVYYVVGVGIAAGISGMVSGVLTRRFLRGSALPLFAHGQTLFEWSWPWYMTALFAAALTGLWPSLPGLTQPGSGFIAYALLAFGLLFYLIALLEERVELLWLGSLFSGWSFLNSAFGNDFPRLFIATFIYALIGVMIGRLRRVRSLSGSDRQVQRLRYALPFYVSALISAVLGSCVVTRFTLHQILGGVIPDAIPLLVFAGLAFGILLWEQKARWLWLVAGFGLWGTLLAPRASTGWVIGIAFVFALSGLLIGRLSKLIATREQEQHSHTVRSSFKWSWPWYLLAVVAMLWTLAWQQSGGMESQATLVAYCLLVFALLTFGIMLVEHVPEGLVLPVLFASLAILFWQPHLELVAMLLAFMVLCIAIFASQLIWKGITPLTKSLPITLSYSLAGLGGQLLVVFSVIVHGGLSDRSGLLAFVGTFSLLVLSVMVVLYGRLQANLMVRRICDYLTAGLGALTISWLLVALGHMNLDLLTLAPATFLIVITPILLRDEMIPENRVLGEISAVAGATLLLLPTLWLSFTGDAGNLWYTLILLGEALALLLVGIGVGVRIFVLTGAGLIIIAALHALFLPSLGIPTPVALTLLGITLLGVATVLSMVRRRLRTAWSQWE